MKNFFGAAVAAAILLSSAAAMAADVDFNAGAEFVGTVVTQHGAPPVLGYVARVTVFDHVNKTVTMYYNTTIQSQESYADHLAIQTRADCYTLGTGTACLSGNPNWYVPTP